MFRDKIYEEMDDISKLIEPYQSKLNEELSQFPEEIDVTEEVMLTYLNNTYYGSSVNLGHIITQLAERLKLFEIKEKSHTCARDFFEFKVIDLEEYDKVKFDLVNRTISHRIIIAKKKVAYEDDELEKMVKKNICSKIIDSLYTPRFVNKARLNEIADLFGAKQAMSERATNPKVRALCTHLESLVDSKKLDIRDVDLCKKFGEWVVLYVRDGNLAALNNLTRLKIMTHQNKPIYSIEERSVR